MKKEPKKPKSGKKVKKTSKRTKASFKRFNKAKSDKKNKEEQDDGEAHRLEKSFVVITHNQYIFPFPIETYYLTELQRFPMSFLSLAATIYLPPAPSPV